MKIAICLKLSFDSAGAYKYRGDESRQFREALLSLAGEIAKEFGDKLYFVELSNLKSDGSFDKYYVADEQSTNSIRLQIVEQRLMPDLVINRRKDELYHHPYLSNAPWLVYNAAGVARLGDKAISWQRFFHYMPVSMTIDASLDTSELERLLDHYPAVKQWTVKPLRQNGGRGIELLDRGAVVQALAQRNESVLVQEFCETVSVPELDISGRHDVRVYVVDGEPLLIAVRRPKEGGFLANTAAGGSIRFMDIGLLPEAAMKIVRQIAVELSEINKRYFVSIDLFCTENGWKLVELNDQPGLPAKYQTPAASIIFGRIVKSMKGMVCDGK